MLRGEFWLTMGLFLVCGGLVVADPPATRVPAQHVVLIVWDGMRPDFVTPERAPTLAALARDGVFFRNNHAAYPSSTNVNGAVLATGDYPEHNGIISNQEFRAEIDPLKQFDTSDFPALDASDALISAKYITAPTIAEIVQKAGYRTATAGSKPVAQLFDRTRKREGDAATHSVVIYRGKILPKAAEATIVLAIGPFPNRRKSLPNIEEDLWTTRALTEVLWKNDVPKFSLLWLSEPDLTQHETAPGSPASRAAIKSCDENLARVLDALRAKNALTSTDVIVVSDHGFSTIDLAVDVAQRLRAAGFDAVRAFNAPATAGQVLVVSLGGSFALYVIGHDAAVTRKLVDYLQRSDFAGVILTREKMAGTFTLAEAHLQTATEPDIMVASRWSDAPNEFGARGEVASDLGKNLGQGTHSSFSPHDLDNTLIATGPDFRRGWTDETPSGNIDVAPTILSLLGLKAPQPVDGRVLGEAFRDAESAPTPKTQELEAQRDFNDSSWRQTLSLTTVGKVSYFLQGNGGRTVDTSLCEAGGQAPPRAALPKGRRLQNVSGPPGDKATHTRERPDRR